MINKKGEKYTKLQKFIWLKNLKNIDFILKICNNILMKKVAIFGGTFNPVHLEHVSLCQSAIKELDLDKLIVMPTFISPHKANKTCLSATDRLNMLKLAFEGQEKIEVSDFEILKEGKSYTYQTIESFYQQGVKLYFIVGGDMLNDFKTWRNPERILDKATLVVFERQSIFTDFEKEQEYFSKTFCTNFIKLSYVGKDFSSTKIRTYAKFGLSLEGLMPKKVEDYIKQNELYKPDRYEQFVIKNLPEKRLKHTADVVVCALKRARELGLDEEKVRLSATLHDVAKYIDHTTEKEFVLPDKVPQPVIHAYLGAFIAQKYLGIDDAEIIDAIRYHTSGRANMSLLEKLVFVADMVEEGRVYEGVDKLRYLYENRDFENCFIECLKEEFMHLLNKKQYIYVKTIEAFNYYVK